MYQPHSGDAVNQVLDGATFMAAVLNVAPVRPRVDRGG